MLNNMTEFASEKFKMQETQQKKKIPFFFLIFILYWGIADCASPWVGKVPWRRAWQPTPIFLPGESHGQRSLAGCSPCGRIKLDMK